MNGNCRLTLTIAGRNLSITEKITIMFDAEIQFLSDCK